MSFAFMPFYTGDYYRDTRHLSMLQHGAYRQLLDHCWDQKGPLPLDAARCFRICGAVSKEEQDAVGQIIAEFFVRMEDGHYNRRMQLEIERAAAVSSVRSDAAHTRWKAREAVRNMDSAAQHANAMQEHSKSNASGPPHPHPHPHTQNHTHNQTQEDIAPSALPARARKRATAEPGITVETWKAYSEAYQARHGSAPVDNAAQRGKLAQFVKRLGADEAPGVARFYCGHRAALYVSAKHCTDLLLRDAEKLRTEWATGNVTYAKDARESDRLGANGEMWAKIGADLDAKKAAKGIT
jgi:uncharacterized protein YdaU (DUF1376 family)